MQNHFQLSGSAIGFQWPNGEVLFSDISFSFGCYRYGLIGVNGVGKTSFGRLLCGALKPTQGHLLSTHTVSYFAQEESRAETTVAEYLSSIWESPEVHPQFWQQLLENVAWENPLKSLSGGEWTRVRLVKSVCQPVGCLILDEPTNNLDKESRHLVLEFIKTYQQPLVIISHDRELLEHVHVICELSNMKIFNYQGNYSQFKVQKDAEVQRQAETLDRARREKKKRELEATLKIKAQEKRLRKGSKQALKGDMPRILSGARKRKAEQTMGKVLSQEAARKEQAALEFKEAFDKLKLEPHLDIQMPETQVPQGKLVFELEKVNVRFSTATADLWASPLSLRLKGSDRMALEGSNGVGKSTLINILLNRLEPTTRIPGAVTGPMVPTAHLDQDYTVLKADDSVLSNVLDSSRFDQVETRNLLARFLFTHDKVHQSVASLSGGEKLKAALAKILLSDPAPQFLILDEPTNNLDLQNLEILEEALLSFKGALLVVSHDESFLSRCHILNRVRLG